MSSQSSSPFPRLLFLLPLHLLVIFFPSVDLSNLSVLPSSSSSSSMGVVDGEVGEASIVDGEVTPPHRDTVSTDGHTFDINPKEEEQRLTHFEV